jgi:hypothetical protein
MPAKEEKSAAWVDVELKEPLVHRTPRSVREHDQHHVVVVPDLAHSFEEATRSFANAEHLG